MSYEYIVRGNFTKKGKSYQQIGSVEYFGFDNSGVTSFYPEVENIDILVCEE